MCTVGSFLFEVFADDQALSIRRHAALPSMVASSVLSGVSGSSGPLKGIAIRSLNLPRLEHVGAAASVSLVADALKVELLRSQGLFDGLNTATLLIALPVMPLGALLGRGFSRRATDRTFQAIFWAVVGGYALRLFGWWF